MLLYLYEVCWQNKSILIYAEYLNITLDNDSKSRTKQSHGIINIYVKILASGSKLTRPENDP